MKLIVFSIRDTAARGYLEPFYAQTPAVGFRRWAENVGHKDCMFHKHPDDYTLWEIGTFDQDTGQHDNYKEGPINHGTARLLLNELEREQELRDREPEEPPAPKATQTIIPKTQFPNRRQAHNEGTAQ